MTTAERQDADVTPPTVGSTPGLNITSLATTTTSATHDLQAFAEMFGRFLNFTADGGTIYVAFSATDTGPIDENVSDTSVANGTEPRAVWPIRDGEVTAFRLTAASHRYLHVKAASGTPKLRICGSSPRSV